MRPTMDERRSKPAKGKSGGVAGQWECGDRECRARSFTVNK